MRIREVCHHKKQYLDLLLLADEQEDMIDRYLEPGRLFVLEEAGACCVAVVVELDPRTCELKNLATRPDSQGRGYGQAMVAYLLDLFLQRYHSMYVGTGDVPRILRFYERCGFRPSHRDPDFFVRNYRKPLYEDGLQLADMVYLRADRQESGTAMPVNNGDSRGGTT